MRAVHKMRSRGPRREPCMHVISICIISVSLMLFIISNVRLKVTYLPNHHENVFNIVVSGIFRPGMNAIMGATGSGKTS